MGQFYSMVLYSPSRWTSLKYSFKLLITVRPVHAYMNHVLMNERDSRKVSTKLELPKSLESIISERYFWKGFINASETFDPMCMCIVFLDSDTCSKADVYAAFLFV